MILLADDEPAFQRLTGQWLRSLGHEVETVGDGDAALAAFARIAPDVVLLDLCSFTGAHADRPGLVEAASGGTLFLDEIGEMPAAMQVKLLRFLADGSYQPVGARETRHADVRIVAATHRNLENAIADGSFREGLYYRLRGLVLRTPALDERPEDIAMLGRATNGEGTFAPDALA